MPSTTNTMADMMPPGVTMYDIRSDKSEGSLLEMIKQGLGFEPKTMPTLLLYDGAGSPELSFKPGLTSWQRKD